MGKSRDICIIFSLLVALTLLSGCISSPGAGKGTPTFTSSPPGAEVYLDGYYRGSTPVTVADVVAGVHSLEYRRTGYSSYSETISVPEGSSQFHAALTAATVEPAGGSGSAGTNGKGVPAPVSVTARTGRDPLIVGDSAVFSGTCSGCTRVLLILYGPGYYSKGVILNDPKVNTAGLWEYTWNPGTSIRSGSYALIASDVANTTSARVAFTVIGDGEVTVSPSNSAVAQGDTVRFSGRCTTNAPSVRLVLYGPGRFAGGSELGTASVMGDKTWNFRFTLDQAMPTGIYTMNVYDVPKTAVGTTQFTVGFASAS